MILFLFIRTVKMFGFYARICWNLLIELYLLLSLFNDAFHLRWLNIVDFLGGGWRLLNDDRNAKVRHRISICLE